MSSTPPPASYVPEPYQPQRAVGHVTDPSVLGLQAYMAQVVVPARHHRRRSGLIGLITVLIVAGAAAVWHAGVFRPGSRPATVPVGSGVSPGGPTDPPIGPGIVYRSSAGHYAARFLGLPTEASKPGAAAGQLFTLHVVTDDGSDSFVESADLYPGIGARQADALLPGLVANVGAPRGLAVAQSKAMTFHDRPAQLTRLVDQSGNSVEVLAVVYGTQRFYLLSADSGAAFDLLKRSFVALP